jgi:hypothetical protein
MVSYRFGRAILILRQWQPTNTVFSWDLLDHSSDVVGASAPAISALR